MGAQGYFVEITIIGLTIDVGLPAAAQVQLGRIAELLKLVSPDVKEVAKDEGAPCRRLNVYYSSTIMRMQPVVARNTLSLLSSGNANSLSNWDHLTT